MLKSQTGGKNTYGSYYFKNGIPYKTIQTYEMNYVSYYEKAFANMDQSDFTTDLRKPNRDKILFINNTNTFDQFTNKYGFYESDLETCYIKWDRVANDYRGVYLDQTNNVLQIERRQYVFYKMYRLNSWWEDYDIVNVAIFDKPNY
jgi:hypothetical protein